MTKELFRATYTLDLPEGSSKFTLTDREGELYFIRELDGKTNSIRVNICHHDIYDSNIDYKISKKEALDNSAWEKITLPPPEREKVKAFEIAHNPDVLHTPARIFTDSGRIETGKRFYDFPQQLRLFILLHEYGHFWYKSEDLADLFALKQYLRLGYNESNAFYALSKILHPTETNYNRIVKLFNEIKNK